MSKEHPSAAHFERLRDLIDAEEERTQQYARRVRISQDVATDLMAMEAEDWHLASRGFTDIEDCDKLANDFLRRGVVAVNGLSISIIGPVLEVAEDLSAPDVEITLGLPYQS